MSGVFLNEFLCCVENLFSACDRLLRNAGCNATDTLGDRLGALGNSLCCAADCLATRQGHLASLRLFRRRSTLGFASAALASWTFARALTGRALTGSALASGPLASWALSASRLARWRLAAA